MWFDSHCHLFDVDGEPAEAVSRAAALGVTDMLVCGTDVPTSQRAAELAGLPGVWAAAGLHPTSAREWSDEVAAALEALLGRDRVVAVGESGLDMYWDTSFLDVQQRVFEAHIAWAKEHHKALVIHTRSSVDEALATLERVAPPERLVFHCWSGDREQMDRALDLGAFVSFAGNVTFKSAGALRELAATVPGDRLLVETDSPYLAPVPHRGKPNEPAHVVFVGTAVAEARGETVGAVAETTARNAQRLLALPGGRPVA
ncbi:MAG TPA: TatD family hydrolase [Actinomycetota bacterium]|nr:TatD family hydrolase [Actinomycetota bacterium]